MNYKLLFIVLGINLLGILMSCNQGKPVVPIGENLGVDEARKIHQSGDATFLDVRTPAEIAEGKIKGALEIDYKSSDFAEQLKRLDKDTKYIVYCRSGGRSAKSVKILKEQGFKSVHNMLGGYTEWKKN